MPRPSPSRSTARASGRRPSQRAASYPSSSALPPPDATHPRLADPGPETRAGRNATAGLGRTTSTQRMSPEATKIKHPVMPRGQDAPVTRAGRRRSRSRCRRGRGRSPCAHRSRTSPVKSVLGELPHRFRRVREEGGFGAQQPLVPGERALVVAHREAREEVDRHAFTLTPQPSDMRAEENLRLRSVPSSSPSMVSSAPHRRSTEQPVAPDRAAGRAASPTGSAELRAPAPAMTSGVCATTQQPEQSRGSWRGGVWTEPTATPDALRLMLIRGLRRIELRRAPYDRPMSSERPPAGAGRPPQSQAADRVTAPGSAAPGSPRSPR